MRKLPTDKEWGVRFGAFLDRLVGRRDCDGVTRGYLCDVRHDSGAPSRRVA